jgi:hypothetical protein
MRFADADTNADPVPDADRSSPQRQDRLPVDQVELPVGLRPDR